MTDAAVFGTSIDGTEVEHALIDFLRGWMPTYIGWAKRRKDPDDTIWPVSAGSPLGVADIASYGVVHQVPDKWPEDQLPMLLAYSRGLGEPPVAQGDGSYRGRYIVLLSSIAQGIDATDSEMLARLYATAARAAILQHPGLDGFTGDDVGEGGVEWVSHENYQIRKGVEAERNLMGVTDGYLIDVPQIINRDMGPRTPAVDPMAVPDDPATVQTHGVAVDADGRDVVGELTAGGFFGNGNEGG